MMKKIAVILLAMAGAGCERSIAPDTAAATPSEVLAVYSFSPHTLTAAQIREKSKALDAFWQKAKSHSKIYVPFLQTQLKERDVPPFFLFDGSMLLMSLSDSAENRRIALQAIARCDLRDVIATDYLMQIHRLAVTGEDTTDAAFHILEQPKFQATISQQALTLRQDYSLIYMLFPTHSTNWLDRAARRLEVETDPTAQQSLLLLLWYAQTSESDRAIAAFAAATNSYPASRDYARELLARNGKTDSAPKTAPQEEAIRKTRREILGRISREALAEFDKETQELVACRR